MRLKELRVKAQLSQLELAKRAHVSQQLISHLELGTRKRCNYDIFLRLVTALGCTINDLLNEGYESSNPA